jgi:serine/threonine-protein kinase
MQNAGGKPEVDSLVGQTVTRQPMPTPAVEPTAAEPEGPAILETPKPARPTWWMYVICASYVLTFAVIVYLIVWGPADPRGIVASFADGAMVVRAVAEASPPAQAGVRVGDRVLAIDGQPMRGPRDWAAASGNVAAGRGQQWLVARGEDRVRLDVVSPRASFHGRIRERYIEYSIHVLAGFVLGLLVGWKRPADPVARIGAWFLMTAGIAFGFPSGWAVPWRALPVVLQGLLWIPQLSRFVLEAIFVSFFLLFPRRLVKKPWVGAVVWTPVLATPPWRVAAFYGVIHPGRIGAVPAWILQVGFARTIVYLIGGIVLLLVSYRRLLDANERRRARVVMLGTAASAIAAIVLVWFDSFYGRSLNRAGLSFLIVTPLLLSAYNFSWAYAILRHRILDVSVIVRQGLQYALARGAVLAVLPALGAILVVDLALNSQEPLAAIMRSRGWIYATLGGLALVTYAQRKPWLEAIDGRFFRERYNAQRVLREVVEAIRDARSFERVAPPVVERIEAALHPEFVAVMVRQPDDHSYRAAASVPPGQAPMPIVAEGKLVALLRLFGKALEVGASGSTWLEQRVPLHEIDAVRRARIDLVVPIAVQPGQTEALLALGGKRSQEPYTREDQELLEAIASSLGLLLERSGAASHATSSGFEECPKCGACYDSRSGVCRADGATLAAVHLRRVLAGRYELGRRRGRGGMGTVYEAADRALGRRVAVKVIRDDWVASSEAAQRFRREARASAGFAHPNVVVVHDYGVEAETRAFLVMELLEGETLREELNRSKRLEPSRVLHVMRGVCAAVDAAHKRQLIHRDLKPENIFLAEDGVKVLDFGVAKFLGHDEAAGTRTTVDTQTGVLVGTLPYMSPEQLLGGRPDVLWDLWSLGVTVYEALLGAMPFGEPGSDEWRRRVLSGCVTPVTAPAAWQHFFAGCLSVERSRRPRSAAAFLQELERALA